MRITLSLIILIGPILFLGGCPPSNTRQPNHTCCGDLSASPFHTVDIPSVEISANAGQVPVELIGCGFYGKEISRIVIDGKLAGCAASLGETEPETKIKFSQLNVIFTTSGGDRCSGSHVSVTHEPVELQNVEYRYNIRRFSSPPCVSWSAVSWGSSYSNDPAYHTLFQLRGPQTLLPILDRYVLGWIASIPTEGAVCPPRPIFSGTVSRCPTD